jgi:hypothetical protein
MTHVVFKNPSEIAEEFDSWLLASGLTEFELARAIADLEPCISVSQSWISRIRTGRFTRFSRKTMVVLDYANIRVSTQAVARHPEGQRLLHDALEEAWDGSLGAAKALAVLLRSAGRLSHKGSR